MRESIHEASRVPPTLTAATDGGPLMKSSHSAHSCPSSYIPGRPTIKRTKAPQRMGLLMRRFHIPPCCYPL